MNIVVIGAQWGDEGKGKIVDYLAEDADLIVRFSGGANAGHTIVSNGETYKLHLIPSGIVYPNKQVVLGTGMVIDPEALFSELKTIEKQGINWSNRIRISDRAHIVMPAYKQLDREMDSKRRNPIGTTGRGIGVAYSMKANRDGIRIGDLSDSNFLDTLSKEERSFLDPYMDKLVSMSVNMTYLLEKHKGGKVLFEGAQGILLDLDVGTYPFVSSGYSASAGAALGGGIGPTDIDKVLGVFKAYSTRVGNGPFPSEFLAERDGNLEDVIREIGREYGVTTGRPRRCGYLDLVALRYACLTNSITSLVMTHIDVYDNMDEIKVCTDYEIDGEITREFPSTAAKLTKPNPVLKTFKGWNTDLSSIKEYDKLPQEAKTYIQYIEEYTSTPAGIISVGYERKQTMMRIPLWTE